MCLQAEGADIEESEQEEKELVYRKGSMVVVSRSSLPMILQLKQAHVVVFCIVAEDTYSAESIVVNVLEGADEDSTFTSSVTTIRVQDVVQVVNSANALTSAIDALVEDVASEEEAHSEKESDHD